LPFTLTFKKRSVFPTTRMRSTFRQRFMTLSTRTHITHHLPGDAARMYRRRCVHILPFLRCPRVKSRRTSTISSTTDGRLSLHRRDTIPSRHPRLLGWGSYSTCPRTVAGAPQHQRLRPGDDIRQALRACSTNWIMARDRSVAR
jgi:hypothetical protein